MENSKIEWTRHTFNPWVGCTKVHAGCTHCYAEADMDKRRHFAIWGPGGTRVKTSEENWRKPLKWDREACCSCGSAGMGPVTCKFCEDGCQRPRVFCASLADVFEDWTSGKGNQKPIHSANGEQLFWASGQLIARPVMQFDSRWVSVTLDDLRAGLFELIDVTPNLDWLLLTKRPENIRRMWTIDDVYRPNIWLGTSISDQASHDRQVHKLRECRDLSPVLFLSIEPMLSHIELDLTGIDWVIVGGESGHGARPFNLEAAWSVVMQCQRAGVAVFVKQLGAFCVAENVNNFEFPEQVKDAPWGDFAASCRVILRDKKGGDWSEWPEQFKVRQFPSVV